MNARTIYRTLCAVAFAALTLSGCGSKPKGDPVAAAREFFMYVQKGDTTAAYNSAAFGFRARQSERAFDARVKELGLLGLTEATFQPLEVTGKDARLDAVMTAKSGEKLPFVLSMQQEGGVWRIFAMKSPRSTETGISDNPFSAVGKTTSFNDAVNQPLPSEKTVANLIRTTMLQFNDAVQKKSFADFYETVSVAWQSQLTQKQLQRAFQGFIDKEVNLSGIADVAPELDSPPQVTTDGLMVIGGYYPTRPFQVYFSQKYIYELPNWKLFGLDVNLRRAPEEGAAPGAAVAPGKAKSLAPTPAGSDAVTLKSENVAPAPAPSAPAPAGEPGGKSAGQ